MKIDTITSNKPHKISIQNLEAQISWPQFLANGQIKTLSVEKYETDQKFFDLSSPPKEVSLPDIEEITIKNFVWRLGVPKYFLSQQEPIDLNGKLHIEQNQENDTHTIKATIHSNHKSLSFISQWDSMFEQKKLLSLNGSLEQIQFRNKFLTINRGSGWISFQHDKDDNLSLSGQIESGSGKIFGFPCNDLNLIASLHPNKTQEFSFQTNASGYPGIKLSISSKLDLEKEEENRASLSLSTNSENDVTKYLTNLFPEQNTKLDFLSEEFLNALPTSITIDYLPERKFAGGPFPFELSAQKHKKETLSSTFLIYPKETNLRGNIEGDEATLKLITKIFDLSEEDIVGGNLKLDYNLSNLFEQP
ncbi:MAG: hypothetical protein MRY79_08855 [Alphaproteobacteria bacterium]|nr:hypothetical protein [Alphaproteobacteria bacterium]